MRKDVKLGVLLSFVVVVAAGWYYVTKEKTEEPLTLDDSSSSLKGQVERATPKKSTMLADARKPDRKRPAGRASTSHRSTAKRPTHRQSSTRPPQTAPQPKAAAPTPRRTGLVPPPTDANPKSTGDATPATKKAPAAKTRETPALKKSGVDKPAKDAFDELFNVDKTRRASVEPSTGPPASGTPSAHGTSKLPGTHTRVDGDKKPEPRSPGTANTLGQAKRLPTGKVMTKTAKGYQTHTVGRGDSFAVLAERYYGSQRYTKFLMDANPEHPDPRKLREGMVLRVPPLSDELKKTGVRAAHPSERAAVPDQRTYVVRPGDTFYSIAARKLGNAARWQELFELNKELVGGNAKRLRVGQVLTLPPQTPATAEQKSKKT